MIALVALAAILIPTARYMRRPGGYIEIVPLPEATPAPAEEVAVTSSGSKYHRDGCSALNNSTEVEVIAREEAENQGYEPCQRCEP